MTTAILGYVGPGPGLTMVWAFFALMGTIALALLSVVLWPIRLLAKKIRGTSAVTRQNADMIALDGADPMSAIETPPEMPPSETPPLETLPPATLPLQMPLDEKVKSQPKMSR